MPSRPVLPLAAVLLAAATVAAIAAPAAAGTPPRSGPLRAAHQHPQAHRAAAADCGADDHTGPTVDGGATTPATVALGTTAEKTFHYAVHLSDPCGVDSATLRLIEPGTRYPDDYPLSLDDGSSDTDGTWSTDLYANPENFVNAEAGTWPTSAFAFDPYGNGTHRGSGDLRIVRYAKMTNDATPESVKKNATVTVSGSLVRADWEAGVYKGYASQSVDLQYRTTTGSYHTVKTVTTGSSGGALKATDKPAASGCYRFVFAGTATTSSATGTGDCITVH